MTWGEFVEARYLREYRRSLGATMQRLRAFIEHLRDELGVPYPGDPGGRGPNGFERPPCPVQAGDKDVGWIPQVARAGWIIVSRDRHIQHRPAERQALIAAQAKMFRLDARHGLNKWQQLEIIVTQWHRLEQMSELPGPWLYMATRTSLRKEI